MNDHSIFYTSEGVLFLVIARNKIVSYYNLTLMDMVYRVYYELVVISKIYFEDICNIAVFSYVNLN